jgi:hypothetical protein
MTTSELFLKIANPFQDSGREWDCVSRVISRDEFVDEYSPLATTNGNSWGRSDGQFCRKYKLLTINASGKLSYKFAFTDEDVETFGKTMVEYHKSHYKGSKGNTVVYYQLCGRNDDSSSNAIRQDIKDALKIKRCPVVDVSNVEIDHKNGRKNNPRVLQLQTQRIDDFQPLSKAANDAKRQHCKTCKDTGKRYSAEHRFGVAFTSGSADFPEGNVDGCVGCYWYDIEDFHLHLHLNLHPNPNPNPNLHLNIAKMSISSVPAPAPAPAPVCITIPIPTHKFKLKSKTESNSTLELELSQ